MPRRKNEAVKFAVCIHSEDPDLVTPRRLYQVLPDESASASKYIRIIDNEGEDYLYPSADFIMLELPAKVERALVVAA